MDPPRQLHVTQPAVTQQIQSLEKELNVKLFIRTTRTVRLTEEGKVFLNDARQLVAISNRAKKRFENTNGSEI
ncbi:MAG TPA: LysR family transcriptional regulator [Candidatus Fimiplasma intestinipullorum]|uniref:LysR family transcriptional regulator n=1 Tax=Candidatus Fimiplasma intestinipullorum TaxID=2840825 RepID=A0A9D1HRT4_9FIRM|nr:LysR family transcriptional regulator [Candidatus Fimiplasma intestinipullorum]